MTLLTFCDIALVSYDSSVSAILASSVLRSPTPYDTGGANAREDMFSTPLERSGSLIAMEPMPSPAKPAQQLKKVKEGEAAPVDDQLVYCPVDIAPSSAREPEG